MRLISILSAAVITVAALAATPEALAQRGRNNQSTTSVVINYQRVLTETALGRDMAAKLQQIRAQVGTEAQSLQPEQQSIEQERQRLAQASRNMSPEQIRNSSTLGPQVQQFQQRVQQFEARAQGLRGDFECSQMFALGDFDRQVSPIVRSVMEARGAGVALDASNVQLVLPEFDITNTVIQQLDQGPATRTATVARHAVAECQAQAPAQAPAAQ
ncbi:MAG: OmpH family outer membrane protein [Terricaulis sp.]